MNGDSINNARYKTREHCWNKKRECLKDTTDDFETDSKNKNIRDFYIGINNLKNVTNL
jgi:hypothetical protein